MTTGLLRVAAAFLILGLTACTAQEPATWIEPTTSMEFVLIPEGRFVMGSPPDEVGREAQETVHDVEISKPFYLGRHEVTQGQWVKVMGANPSQFSECGLDCPVENINYHEIQEFISRLEKLSGEGFRLPTEAEWEYACRAGTTTPFHTGENLTTDQANYDGRHPYPVGSFPPNRWDLHDMHGNVWEWTSDWHGPYPAGLARDPRGAPTSELKVIRGGSWYFNADSARCALRYTHAPVDLGPSLGFRLVRPIADP